MSRFKAKVLSVKRVDRLCKVDIEVGLSKLSMVTLELSDEVKNGALIVAKVKPTHIALSRTFCKSVSYSNQLACKIDSIEIGEILTQICLSFENEKIESLITTSSFKKLGLKEGDSAVAFIKATELSIDRVLSE
jgi:molybdopterin-binding protein